MLIELFIVYMVVGLGFTWAKKWSEMKDENGTINRKALLLSCLTWPKWLKKRMDDDEAAGR